MFDISLQVKIKEIIIEIHMDNSLTQQIRLQNECKNVYMYMMLNTEANAKSQHIKCTTN